MKISIENRQLAEFLKAVRRPTDTSWRAEKLLNVVQVLALVVAGFWVLVQFILYQRDDIQLKQAELRESLKLKKIEADIGDLKRSRTSQELAAMMTYRPLVDTKIMVKGANLGNKLDEQTRKQADKPYIFYYVDYVASIKNISDVEFEVSLWVLDYFLGLPKQELNGTDSLMQPVGSPASRWNPNDATKGIIDWKLTGSVGGIYAPAIGNLVEPGNSAADQNDNIKPGAGFLGILKKEQTIDYGEHFLVKAEKDSYVAFVLSLCFNKCQDLVTNRNYSQLAEDKESSSINGDSITPIKSK
jgi:hypothetical protein